MFSPREKKKFKKNLKLYTDSSVRSIHNKWSFGGAQNSKLKNPGSGLLHKRKQHNNGEAISGMKQDDLYSEFPSLFLETTSNESVFRILVPLF